MTSIVSKKTYDGDFVRKVKEISGENFHKCMQCGTCSGSCPVTDLVDLTTRKVMLLAHFGMKDKLMRANTAWYCAACQTCYVRCPRGIDIPSVMEALRQLALRQNENHIEPNKIDEEAIERLPQIALVSCFRKHTS